MSSAKKIVDGLPPGHPARAKYLALCYRSDNTKDPHMEMEEKEKLSSSVSDLKQ